MENINQESKNIPDYYVVAVTKFILMSLSTFGIYIYYWVYKNWTAIKEHDNSQIWPIARTIFLPFTFMKLAGRIKSDANKLDIKNRISPGISTIVLLLTCIPAFTLFIFYLPYLTLLSTLKKFSARFGPDRCKKYGHSFLNFICILFGLSLNLIFCLGYLSEALKEHSEKSISESMIKFKDIGQDDI